MQPSLNDKLNIASAIFGSKHASASGVSSGGIGRETDPTVPDWAKQPEKPKYTAAEVGADPSGSASSALSEAKAYADRQIAAIPTPDVSGQIGAHNVAADSHNDIRLIVKGLTDRLNALADSDDATLDQMSEIVAYIKANRGLIESVTTTKVNVSDIIDNLTTNVGDRPLSAAQGVALKALIDAIKVPTNVSAFDNDAGYITSLPYRIRNYQEGSTWITDPNSVTETGFYYIASGGTNRPPFSQSTNLDYRILTTAYSSEWLQQIATDFRCPDVFVRRRQQGVWMEWEKLAYSSEIPSLSGYATQSWVEGKNYLTQHQSLADYAKKSDVPTNKETWTFTLEDGSTVTRAVYVE